MTRFFAFINRMFAAAGSWLQSPLLLALRLFFGISFMIAGIGKLSDLESFTGQLTSLNIPYPEVGAWLAALSETIGGFFLAIGFLARFAAFFLIITMTVAYSTAHVEAVYGFFQNPNLFVAQAPFNFLLTALFVFAFGPGYFAIDNWFTNAPPRPTEKPGK